MHHLERFIVRIFNFALKMVCPKLPLANLIILESNPDFTCNAYPLLHELRKKRPNFRLVWAVWHPVNPSEVPREVDATIRYANGSLTEQISYLLCVHRAKAIVSCNRMLCKRDHRQLALYLTHGSKTKRTSGWTRISDGIDFVCLQSHFFDEVAYQEYACGPNKLVYLGSPRCDYFFQPRNEEIGNFFFNDVKARFLIWLPTFRNNGAGRNDAEGSHYNDIGMPLIYTTEQLMQLNEQLRKNQLYLLYKPHPVQDISGLKAHSLSNIKIINDEMLKKKGMQLYELMAAAEGLITDYSSVLYDFLLSGKPIAMTLDDVEEWQKGIGFPFDLVKLFEKASSQIFAFRELETFIHKLAQGIDEKSEERRNVCYLTNMYMDGQSSARTADFILNTIDKTYKRMASRGF